jgi:intracellular multiplication protein IcmV
VSFFAGIKKIIKPFVDVPKWIGYRQLVKSNCSLTALFKKFFIPEKAHTQESFAVALQRLNLKESDLIQRRREFTRLMWIWIFLFFVTIAYSVYLFMGHSLRGFFPSLAISFIILTQIFRYHFWIFQIKQRRLGCNFRDWLSSYFMLGKK